MEAYECGKTVSIDSPIRWMRELEAPVLEDRLRVLGIDNLPMARGMTVGELALPTEIGVDLKVVHGRLHAT